LVYSQLEQVTFVPVVQFPFTPCPADCAESRWPVLSAQQEVLPPAN